MSFESQINVLAWIGVLVVFCLAAGGIAAFADILGKLSEKGWRW